MIRDFNVEWLEKRVYIPAWSFQSQVEAAGVNAFLTAGAPIMQELGTLNLAGVQVAAAGDAIAHTMMMPYDIDRSKQVRFRVWFSSTATDADIITFLVSYSAVARGVLIVNPEAATGTALSTPIPAITRGTVANAIEATDFGIINRNTLAETAEWFSVAVEADAIGAATANEISILGLEMRYTPRKTAGPRRNVLGGKRLVADRPLGVQLHASQEGL